MKLWLFLDLKSAGLQTGPTPLAVLVFRLWTWTGVKSLVFMGLQLANPLGISQELPTALIT